MKYWFFDGSDVVGPFSPQELLRRKGFSVSTGLVCPENFSEDEDSWKTASSFADFRQDGQPAPAEPAAADCFAESTEEEAALFDKEMDTFLKNPSILAGTAEPAPDGPPLEIPKKPAKPNPIEDYFNHINSEDLGGILGIPDPAENSDMNLPRAFEKEFDETVPPADKEIDFVEADTEEAEKSAAADDPASETPAVSARSKSEERETEKNAASQPLAEATAKSSSESSASPIVSEEASSEAASQTAEVPRRVRQEEPASVKLVQEEPAVVISVVEENAEPVLVLPVKEEPKHQSEDAEVPPEEVPAPAQETSAEPEAENVPTCTLPLIGEENESVSLPEIPKDGVFMPNSVQTEDELFVSVPDLQAPADVTQVLPKSESNSVLSETEAAPAPLNWGEEEAEKIPVSRTSPAFTEKNIPETMDDPEPNTSTCTIVSEDMAPENVPQALSLHEASAEPEELIPAATKQQGAQQADLCEPVREKDSCLSQKDSKEQTVRDILRGKLTVSAEDDSKEPLKTLPIEPEVNQIKPKLNQTPEITRFLDRQSRIVRRSRNKKANMMLWILAGLLAFGVLYAILRLVTPRPAVPASVAPAVAAAPAVSVSAAAPSVQAKANTLSVASSPTPVRRVPELKPVLPPAPLTAADRALAAVQNYRLSGDRGTIASYFDRMYKTQLSHGYTGNWSAEALHKNIYIVKYRLSKTRLEPVVYVFQADAAQGKLTGALNNAALDLVGKI